VAPNLPGPPNFYILHCLSYLRIVGEYRDVKFGGQVNHVKSQPMEDKPSLKGAWSRRVTNFKFLGPNHIYSEITEATFVKFCTHVG